MLHEVLTKTNMADEEEDYMSDAFLLGLEDTGPGLAFGAAAREYKKEANRKQKETENRVKPLKQRESERREKALSNAIDSSNKGFALLQKMGYKEGKGLGKHGMILCILFWSYDNCVYSITIDLTDYSLLPNGLVSMLTYFSMSGAGKDYILMFSWTNLFPAVFRLNNRVIFNPTKQSTKHE